MAATIALLAIACIAVLGLFTALGLSRRTERRAGHRGEHRITRSGPHTSLVSGWDPEHPPGGPDHPDWPRPPQQ
jgi:hypothetical protein